MTRSTLGACAAVLVCLGVGRADDPPKPDPKPTAADVARLRADLKAPEFDTRRRAAIDLAKAGDRSGVPVLLADLDTVTGPDRNNLLVALRIIKDPRAVPALRKALSGPTAFVRCIAAEALGEMKATEAYTDLVALTRDKDWQRGLDPKGLNCIPHVPAGAACYALGALGDRRAVPVLIDCLADGDLRHQARQGLEALTGQKLGDDPAAWAAWWKRQDR